MANVNVNTSFCSAATSPNFIKQRKIAYVDNPFDELMSLRVMERCDAKYVNFPRNERCAKENVSRGSSSEDAGEKMEELRVSSSWELDGEAENCDSSFDVQDLSALFSPVQCQINSPAGEIQLSLSYDPWLGSLKVAIMKARGLTCSICARKAHNSGIICVGTFINISLLCENKRIQSRRTGMKTRKEEIFFYEKFSFLAPRDDIRDCKLQCQAVHKVGSIIKREHVIGQVLIGLDDGCDGDGSRHWEEMIRRPKKGITQWYYIKET